MRRLALALLIALGAPHLALAAPMCALCDRSDASFVEGAGEIDLAGAPRCDEPAPQAAPPFASLPIDLDCRDDTNPIFSAAVGTCDLPTADGMAAPAPVQPVPAHGPLLCDGPSCRPQHAPLASHTQLMWGAPPLCGVAARSSIVLRPSALAPSEDRGPRAGHQRRIDRPPRA